MTREEAITQLKMDSDLCNFNPMTGEEEPMNEDCRKTAEALDIAIKSLEQEPCKDVISRKAVLNQIFYSTDNSGDVVLGSNLRKRIEKLPPVTPTRMKGKWIIDDADGERIWHCHCSNCKKDPQIYVGGSENWWLVRLPNYCPKCGIEMESENNGKMS